MPTSSHFLLPLFPLHHPLVHLLNNSFFFFNILPPDFFPPYPEQLIRSPSPAVPVWMCTPRAHRTPAPASAAVLAREHVRLHPLFFFFSTLSIPQYAYASHMLLSRLCFSSNGQVTESTVTGNMFPL